jgi:hypothetical protein
MFETPNKEGFVLRRVALLSAPFNYLLLSACRQRHNANRSMPHCRDIFTDFLVRWDSMAKSEAMTMKSGDLVIAETVSEGFVSRRIVEVDGDTIYICTEAEWLSAKKDNREPLCVGFNQRYVSPVTA